MGDGVGRVVELLARGRCVVELLFAGGVGGVVGGWVYWVRVSRWVYVGDVWLWLGLFVLGLRVVF